MNNGMFRVLNPKEIEEFKAWAHENYKPHSEINEAWHPVVQDECKFINDLYDFCTKNLEDL